MASWAGGPEMAYWDKVEKDKRAGNSPGNEVKEDRTLEP